MIDQPHPLTLSPDELADLTGTTRKRDQAEWLKANRIPFLLDKKDRPKVLRATLEAIMGAPQNLTNTPALRFASR